MIYNTKTMRTLYLLLILPLFIFAGCSKDNDTKPDVEENDTEVEFESGEGGLFIGSVSDKALFDYRIVNSSGSTAKTGTVAGRQGNKALASDCKFTKNNSGQFVKLVAGEYRVIITPHADPQDIKSIEVTITAGKCSSVEANGVAW